MNLYPFQIPAEKALIRALAFHDSAGLCTPTGSGKTHITCSVAKRAGARLAVVCPKSVVPAWERAAADWGVELAFVSNYELIKRRDVHGHWAIKNRRWTWTLPENTLLIFDEAHRCRSRTSQNAKLLIAAVRERISHVLVTATLAENPLQMYALGYSLGLHELTDWFPFMVMSGCRKGPFAWEYKAGAEGMARLNARIFPTRGYTAKHADLPGFPESLVSAFALPVKDPARVNEMWARLEALNALRDADAERAGDEGVNPLVESLRLRQESELLKVPAIVELVEDAVADGMSVVVFVNFTATKEELLSRLVAIHSPVSVIEGGQTPELRVSNIDAFQNDQSRVLVSMIQAGGVGISLHDLHGNHPRLALISPGWSSTELIQALGRIHRVGAKSPATQHILTAAGTIEDRIARAVNAKVDNISALNDADLRTW